MIPPVSVSVPPVVTVGVAVPPVLAKVRPASVLLPTRVSVEGPLSVTVLAAAIWPALVDMFTEPPLIVRPPAGITVWPTPPPSTTWPRLTTVPPV